MVIVAVAAPEVEQFIDDLFFLLRTDLGSDQMDNGGEKVFVVDVTPLVSRNPSSNDLLHLPDEVIGNVHLVGWHSCLRYQTMDPDVPHILHIDSTQTGHIGGLRVIEITLLSSFYPST